MVSLSGNLGEFLSSVRNFFLVKIDFLKKIFSSNKNSRHWDELDRDLMELIIMKLNLCDTIRLKNVCRSWRSSLLQNKIRKYPLLVLSEVEDREHLRCVCISGGTIHNLKLPELLLGGWYIGFSKNWLFMKKIIYPEEDTCQPNHRGEWCIFMFNMDSGKVFQLPLPSTIPQIHDDTDFRVGKIELSSPDPSTCAVAVILSIEDKPDLLALCKIENKHWNVFSDDDLDVILDMVFLNGELCILLGQEIDDKYRTFKIDNEEEAKLRIFSVWDPLEDPDDGLQFVNNHHIIITNYTCDGYLVESFDGELLLVRRFYDIEIILPKDYAAVFEIMEGGLAVAVVREGEEDLQVVEIEEFLRENNERGYFKYYMTRQFEVFKVDRITGNLSEVKCLGEQAIFVGRGSSLMLEAGSCSGVEPNCIYFASRGLSKIPELDYREVGIYKLDASRIHRCFPSIHNSKPYSMGWMTIETHSNDPFQ